MIFQSGAAVVCVYLFLKYMTGKDKAQEVREAAFVKAMDTLSRNIGEQSDNSKRVAEATEKAAVEAAQRNGHLGEQNIEIAKLVNENTKLVKDSNAAVLSAIKELKG